MCNCNKLLAKQEKKVTLLKIIKLLFQIEVLRKYLNLGYDLLDQYDENIIQKMFTLFQKNIYS